MTIDDAHPVKPRWRMIVDQVAEEHHTTYREARRRSRRPSDLEQFTPVRVAMAHALRAEGRYSSTQIGRWLNRHHTTILLYLGRLHKKER